MKVLFWNVDTQKDFMNKDGKLYVEGAETIKPNLKILTDIARKYKIKVVNTGDLHNLKSKEISNKPDFKTTFPEHCLAGTEGTEFIEETSPYNDFKGNHYVVNWFDKALYGEYIDRSRNIIIYKDDFDVFKGNSFTEEILEKINPDIVFVYGVATNVCVNFAVLGLVVRGKNVVIIKDAIKELPNLPVEEIYKDWENRGVIFENTKILED